MPTAAQLPFSVQELERWMRSHLAGFSGTVQLEQYPGGQSNPTFRIAAGEKRYVLRCKPAPAAKLLPSAHAIEREFRVISALAGTGVPVPVAHGLREDESVIGRAFYIMGCVEGRVFWDPALPGIPASERARCYDDMNRVLAALHAVDYAAAGLSDFGKSGGYLARQIARWSKQYKASETDRIDAMDRLMSWLPENIPAFDDTSVVHGDYRIDNLIFHPAEPRVIAVVDWEL